MTTQEFSFSDYMAIVRRRWRPALMTGLIVAFTGIYVTFSLPAVYESSATILIEQQGIPLEIVQTTVTGYADERLQSIRQRVLATPRVTELIEKFDLYPELRSSLTKDELVAKFRGDSNMMPLNVNAVHDRSGRETSITYAFQIFFRYPEPAKARDVVAEKSRLWLGENESLRREMAGRAMGFLESESARVREELSETQSRLAEFKESYSNSLPESQMLNLQTRERVQTELTTVENQLRSARERKSLLESDMAETPRYRPIMSESGEPLLGGADRLVQLHQELIAARGRYSDTHPDVIRLRREIAALSQDNSNTASLAEQLRASREQTRRELDIARESFSRDHPDVLRLERQLATIEEQLTELGKSGGTAAAQPQPNNPAYLQLQTRIRTADSEVQDLTRRRSELLSSLSDLDRRLGQAPQVEREYAAMVREHDLLQQEYRDLRAKQNQAGLAETLESGQSGERLTVIEPASVPTSPAQPNRASMSFLSIIVAIAMALGVVSVVESTDSTVRGQRDVRTLLDMPPLAIIPYIETRADTRRRILSNALVGLVVVIAIGALSGRIL